MTQSYHPDQTTFSSAEIALDSPFNIYTVETVRQQLLEALSKYHSVRLICTTSAPLDLPAVQLIASTRKTALAMGRQISFHFNISDDMLSLMQRTGMHLLINEPA